MIGGRVLLGLPVGRAGERGIGWVAVGCLRDIPLEIFYSTGTGW